MNPQFTEELIKTMLDPRIADDPLAFVKFCFPWGKKGTPLAELEGPRKWQVDELNRVADHIRENKIRISKGEIPQIYQSATASGRGVGKSALSSWLMWWMMSTRLGSTTVVAANSEPQLKSKTIAELGKWHTLAINRDWFERSTLALKPSDWFSDALQKQMGIDSTYYYVQGQLWSEENPDSFAGAHNLNGMMVVFDEASGISENIWTVTKGFFTDISPDRFWFAFSNPRRNSGAFFDCFHAHSEFWLRRNLDARTVEGSDVAVLESIIKQHGEDSDAARVEVKGQFPRTGDRQFIGRELVQEAQARDATVLHDAGAALIMGVDPARFGSDSSVICFRQGRVNRPGLVPPPTRLKNVDNMKLADTIAYQINKYNPDAVCIDAGNGTGVIDRLRQRGFKVHEVWFGAKADESDVYANKRVELWGRMREWLGGAALDQSSELSEELTAPEYKFQGNSDKQLLESKEDLKKRGFDSPDYADALACTFAVNVAHRDLRAIRKKEVQLAQGMDYNIFDSGEF